MTKLILQNPYFLHKLLLLSQVMMQMEMKLMSHFHKD